MQASSPFEPEPLSDFTPPSPLPLFELPEQLADKPTATSVMTAKGDDAKRSTEA